MCCDTGDNGGAVGERGKVGVGVGATWGFGGWGGGGGGGVVSRLRVTHRAVCHFVSGT